MLKKVILTKINVLVLLLEMRLTCLKKEINLNTFLFTSLLRTQRGIRMTIKQ